DWEMRLVTRTETKTTADNRSVTTESRAHCSRSASCRCGQQLDMCARAHCPRCGRSLRRP
ncbi:MAG: hypothetical protein ACJ72A_14905, partial [Nocardioidaceae bacterium]